MICISDEYDVVNSRIGPEIVEDLSIFSFVLVFHALNLLDPFLSRESYVLRRAKNFQSAIVCCSIKLRYYLLYESIRLSESISLLSMKLLLPIRYSS